MYKRPLNYIFRYINTNQASNYNIYRFILKYILNTNNNIIN